MQNIIVIPFPYWGPVNGSLKIARTLQENGYNIIYVIPLQFSDFIKQQGFEIFLYDMFNKSKPNGLFKKIKESYSKLKTRDTLMDAYAFQLIAKFKPVQIFVDSDVPRYAAVLQRYVNLIMYSITPCNDREENIPPYFSRYIPKKSWFSKLYVTLIWNVWYIKKWLYFLKYEVLTVGYFDFYLKRYYKKHRLNISNLNFNRAWPVGFKDIPELMLYPAKFDFNKKNTNSNKYYLSSIVDLKRNEQSDFSRAEIKHGKSTICCSMGTLAHFYYPEIETFFKLLIEAISTKKDITLILITGDIKCSLKEVPPNIYIYPKAPLLKILERCDLFISHGGMNSVQEAILKDVPLLLFPLSKQNDQNGIAARCVFHGIGKRRNIRNASVSELINDITEILTNDGFKKNLSILKKDFNKPEEDCGILLDLVRSRC